MYCIDMATTVTPPCYISRFFLIDTLQTIAKTGYATGCYGNYVTIVTDSIFKTSVNIFDNDLALCFDTEHDTLQIMIKN